ncbi:MAG: S1 RNA-binding domain-containing protein [Oscillospiraceae bacterium]
MEFEKGAVVKGKVTGIVKFGAFVELAPGKSGLVYISEISNTFVKDVADFLKVGQEVTVKVISIDEAGRINLSIKQAAAPAQPAEPVYRQPRAAQEPVQDGEPPVNAEFEDKLKRFMKDSDSKMSDLRRQSERRGSRRRRG